MNAAIAKSFVRAGFPARRPGSTGLKVLLLLLAVAAAGAGGWVAISSRASASTQEDKSLSVDKGIVSSTTLDVTSGAAAKTPDPRDAAVQEIKQKAAKDLAALGVSDVGNDGGTFCVYVDQRFTAMSRPQQEQLLGLLAAKWKEATSAATVPVKVFNSETRAALFELSF